MRRALLGVVLVLFAVSAVPNGQTPARRVAITIDDGPVVGEPSDLANFQRVTNGLIAAFVAEKVPVTVFINEGQLNVQGQRDARAAVLDQWLDAGFEIGNHTYSHKSANNVPVDEFLDDAIKGEVVMAQLLKQRGKTLTWFRYPYLHSGQTAEIHDIILTFLDHHGYRAAPVTVDYADYSFAGVYRRELRAGNVDVAEGIKQAYLDQVDVGFDRAERASVEVFGREIAQILLIHCNELNSVSLRESIARMRQRGYQFITLGEAMRDEVYTRPDTFAGSGGSWISRSARALSKELTLGGQPPLPQWIQMLQKQ
jgi:peptidoglycan/xylan/chitin deacetylase (PgdA/CDA1 family)